MEDMREVMGNTPLRMFHVSQVGPRWGRSVQAPRQLMYAIESHVRSHLQVIG